MFWAIILPTFGVQVDLGSRIVFFFPPARVLKGIPNLAKVSMGVSKEYAFLRDTSMKTERFYGTKKKTLGRLFLRTGFNRFCKGRWGTGSRPQHPGIYNRGASSHILSSHLLSPLSPRP